MSEVTAEDAYALAKVEAERDRYKALLEEIHSLIAWRPTTSAARIRTMIQRGLNGTDE